MYCIAEALYTKSATTEAKLDLSFFLNDCSIEKYPVDSLLPGRPRYPIEKVKVKKGMAIQKVVFVGPMCGGVYFKVKLSKEDFQSTEEPKLKNIQSRIISSRPNDKALWWDVHNTNI